MPLVNPYTSGPSDTSPPVTIISVSGTVRDNGWYISDVEVTLAASDDDSGVASTEFSFDATTWNTYGAPLIITNEGTITIYYRSTDNVGNVEETKSETISIDKTPPDMIVDNPAAYGLYEMGMTLDFSAYDSHSGLSQLWGTLTDADDGSQSISTGYEPYVGVYTLVVKATDGAGNYAEGEPVFFVVYDPEGGFVTGGGWIYSEPGAYKPDLTLEGRATFGFVSKYKKGMTVPTGNTEFVFQTGDLNFHSSSYDWLVVTGSNYARFKGMGTMNGSGEYKFQIWAGDNAPDTFRIKIWTESTVGEVVVEDVVYDNGFDQAIEAGSIVVHTK